MFCRLSAMLWQRDSKISYVYPTGSVRCTWVHPTDPCIIRTDPCVHLTVLETPVRPFVLGPCGSRTTCVGPVQGQYEPTNLWARVGTCTAPARAPHDYLHACYGRNNVGSPSLKDVHSHLSATGSSGPLRVENQRKPAQFALWAWCTPCSTHTESRAFEPYEARKLPRIST